MKTVHFEKRPAVFVQNAENSVFVSFPYSPLFISIIKQQPIRYFHKDTKEWEITEEEEPIVRKCFSEGRLEKQLPPKSEVHCRLKPSVRIKDKQSLFVSFPYNEVLLDLIKKEPVRFFIKETKEWELPIKVMFTFVKKLSALYKEGPSSVEETPALKIPQETKKLEQYDYPEMKSTLMNHQKEGFQYLMNHNKSLLLYDMGLGKTITSIAVAIARKNLGQIDHCIVICGVNSIKFNWAAEVHTHSNEDAYILGQRENRKGNLVVRGNKEKLIDVCDYNKIKEFFIITNVETLRDVNIMAELKRHLGKRTMVIVDEIHKCNNIDSKQGKAMLDNFSDVGYFYGLTGTIVRNNPLDVYLPLKIIGAEKRKPYEFKMRYCIMGGFENKEVVGYKNVEEIQKFVDAYSICRNKKEVLNDLPDKTLVDEYLEMTPAQRTVYNQMKKRTVQEFREENGERKRTFAILGKFVKMRQATAAPEILSSVTDSIKMDRALEILENAVSEGQKVVVFSIWEQVIDAFESRISKYNPAKITGAIQDREEQKRRFMEDDDCKVIIGTVGAMGTGYTLTAGTVAIFLDEPWTAADKAQAEDRLHRIGAKNNVVIYTLMCKGTIDEKVHQIINEKKEVSTAVVHSSPQELVDFLLD